MVLETEKIYQGNCIEVLKDMPDESIDCVVTSPPYWGLRDYGKGEQLGLEETPEEFVANLVKVFSEVKRVLKKEGTVWLNLGDSYMSSGYGMSESNDPKNNKTKNMNKRYEKECKYCKKTYLGTKNQKFCSKQCAGVDNTPRIKKGILKAKDLCGIPWRVAFALQSDGWYLRQDIIWAKNNCMPEPVKDRCTKSHEYIFLLTKSPKYFYDADAVKEKTQAKVIEPRMLEEKREIYKKKYKDNQGVLRTMTRNKRSVWRMNTASLKDAHFAVFPIELPTYCIKAGCPEGGIVLDPFFGSGTTGLAAQEHNRHWVGIELNEEYIEIAHRRLAQKTLFV